MANEKFYREVQIERGAVDAKNRRVSLAFSSEAPVQRGAFNEVLSHIRGDFDLQRLNNRAPLLVNHDPDLQVGVVESAAVETDQDGRPVGRAIVRFSKSALGEEIFQDVIDGIRTGTSFGYVHTAVVSRSKPDGDGIIAVRYRWQAFELSLASVPADTSVGVGRSHEKSLSTRHFMETENNTLTEISAVADVIAKDFPHLTNEIRIASSRAILTDKSIKDFKREILAMCIANPPSSELARVHDHELGLNRREIGDYKLLRAIKCMVETGKIGGYEGELSSQVEKNCGMRADGFFIPSDIVLGGSRRDFLQRDMTVGVFGQGGAFVPTQIATPIEILRNQTIVIRAGAIVMAGLSGNVAIPRQTSTATAYSLAETATLTDSTATLDQILLSPMRQGATTTYSKQLIIQSSPDVENFIRDDLMKVLAIKNDSLALVGQGAGSEPLGILNTPGIGSVTFGAAATWAKIVTFETALGLANADRGRMAYVTAPNVKGVWKGTAKAMIGATTVTSAPIWENGTFNDESNDGVVNGYRAASTNQIPNSGVMFGNFSDLVLAIFGGFDVVIDPYTLAKKAEVVITVNEFIDVAVRHAASFVCSADSGAQ
jgi:HK97 family phage major capsid protein